MSSDNFTISTRAIYNIFHAAWILMIVFFLIIIVKAITQPTDISAPILFNIDDENYIKATACRLPKADYINDSLSEICFLS